VNRGAALGGGLFATLSTPATWPLALAAFLVRGGFPLVVLPIVVLPSPVGLGNEFAPTLTSVAFRGASVGLVAGVGLVLLALVAWIVIGGLVAAMIEAEAARLVAHSEEAGGESDEAGQGNPGPEAPASTARVASRILAARTLAHVPTGVALIWGLANLVAVAYRELTSPFEVATPIILRVLRGAPEVVAVTLAAWMIGEILGAIAVRRIVLAGAGVRRALRDAIMAALRHPVAVLTGFWVPTAALALAALSSVVAASTAWGIVRAALRSPAEPIGAALAVVLFVAIWLVGLGLIGVMSAWRAAVWSIGGGSPVSRLPPTAIESPDGPRETRAGLA